MALRNQPYIPLYVQDFLTDEKLVECSAQSTGVYIRLMCIMHKSDEYGTFLLKEKDKQDSKQVKNFANKLAKQMPYDIATIENSLIELLEEQVILIDGDKLLQKRMIKDNSISDKRAIAGSIGGKKTQFGKAKPKVNIQANSEDETEYEDESDIVTETIIEDEIETIDEDKLNPKKPIKITFAEFVTMTQEEHDKLADTHGDEFTDKCIEVLDNYKGSKGKKYDSDYRAILNWVVKRVREELGIVDVSTSNDPDRPFG